MGNGNNEWKKEMRLFGIVFWLLSLIDVFHIIIGILYPTVAETNGTLIITLMVYKAAVASLTLLPLDVIKEEGHFVCRYVLSCFAIFW